VYKRILTQLYLYSVLVRWLLYRPSYGCSLETSQFKFTIATTNRINSHTLIYYFCFNI